MNAAERLWRGLAAPRLGGRRGPSSTRRRVVERAGDGARLGVEEYVAAHRVAAAPRRAATIEVLRSRGRRQGRASSRRASATGAARAIYDLHDGRIAGAVEYWA